MPPLTDSHQDASPSISNKRVPQGRDHGNRPQIGALPSSGSGFKHHETAGPMAEQQQQRTDYEPTYQRMQQQRGGVSHTPFKDGDPHLG